MNPVHAEADELRLKLQDALGPTYELGRELGGGGMSRVFVAHERSLDRDVVVKLLLPQLAAGVSVERFRREIALAAHLQHPNIVTVLSAGDADGLPYFTMPFVRGESLRALLRRDGRLGQREAVRVIHDIAAALACAHAEGVVHRDIKPDNVLLSGGCAMVTDFGVARALSSARERLTAPDSTLTVVGTSLGTPEYMAPEQATADPTTDHRADIYALGVTAYEMLAGKLPFECPTQRAAITAHLVEKPKPLDSSRPELAPALVALVMQCLEKDPAQRPQTAAAIVGELEDLPGATRQRGVAKPQHPLLRSRGTWAFAGTAVAIVLVAGAVQLSSRSALTGAAGTSARATAQPTENSDAYDAYLRGVDFFRRAREANTSPSLLSQAIESYEEAVRLDPRFALAYAKLAEAKYWWASLDPSDERRAADFDAALDRAIRLDPSLPEVQAARALRFEH
jgi:serine/threonine protein kinase